MKHYLVTLWFVDLKLMRLTRGKAVGLDDDKSWRKQEMLMASTRCQWIPEVEGVFEIYLNRTTNKTRWLNEECEFKRGVNVDAQVIHLQS